MNVQQLLSGLSNPQTAQHNANLDAQNGNPLSSLSSVLPGGLAGGAAAGGLMALFMGSKSTRKMAGKALKIGGTAVLGGLAYKAYGNWQQNKALGQTQPVSAQDLAAASEHIPQQFTQPRAPLPLHMVLIKTMIAAAKADGEFDAQEQQGLFKAIDELGLGAEEKALVFDFMARDISLDEIARAVTQEEHKAEVYLSAYLAIEVDQHAERAFLNDLADALQLPRGLPAYLEQQADQGVAA